MRSQLKNYLAPFRTPEKFKPALNWKGRLEVNELWTGVPDVPPFKHHASWKSCNYLHFVLLFWNHVFTWASVIFRLFANAALSADARYFCLWNLFSNSAICSLVNDVRGFFLFGGVLFWYGCPIRRVIGNVAGNTITSINCATKTLQLL